MNYLPKVCMVLALLNLAKVAKGEKVKPIKQEVIAHENICKTQPNGAILANPNDCHKFFMCVEQKTREYNCDLAYHYDDSTRSCVLGSACNSDTNKTAVCTENNIRAVQDECNAFEACVKGQYQKLNCPPSYYFNAQQGICLPFKYDAQFKCNCLMPEYTVLENKNNCETYFVCHKKTAVLENCPLGQYYNAKLNTCLTDVAGVCLMTPTVIPEQPHKVKPDFQAICKNLGLKAIHFQTFPKGCSTFSICVKGQLYTQHCPRGFYYDSDKKYCVVDAKNKCSNTENLIDNNLQ